MILKGWNTYHHNLKIFQTTQSLKERIAAVMNEFNNKKAEALGGSGRTDVECLDLNKNDKFNIEAKSTQNSLPSVNCRQNK